MATIQDYTQDLEKSRLRLQYKAKRNPAAAKPGLGTEEQLAIQRSLTEAAAEAENQNTAQTEGLSKTGKIIFVAFSGLLDIVDVATGSASTVVTSVILGATILTFKKTRQQAIKNLPIVTGAVVGDGIPLLGFLPLKLAMAIYLSSQTVQKVTNIKQRFTKPGAGAVKKAA